MLKALPRTWWGQCGQPLQSWGVWGKSTCVPMHHIIGNEFTTAMVEWGVAKQVHEEAPRLAIQSRETDPADLLCPDGDRHHPTTESIIVLHWEDLDHRRNQYTSNMDRMAVRSNTDVEGWHHRFNRKAQPRDDKTATPGSLRNADTTQDDQRGRPTPITLEDNQTSAEPHQPI